MAEPKPLFNTLDDTTGAGTALTQALVGDSPSGKTGLMALGWKDASGNLVLPQLTANGKVPVDTEGEVGTVKRARGSITNGSISPTFVTVATITLANSKKYADISFLAACRQDSLFQVVWNDNGAANILLEAETSPSSTTVSGGLHVDQFTSGATGAQTLIVQAYNFSKNSDLKAAVSCVEGS